MMRTQILRSTPFWRSALVVLLAATLATLAVRAWTGPTQPPAGGNPSGSNASGWISAGETWSYASADAPTFVITVPSDATTKYSPGMRLKLTQTTVKYFLVTAVAATTLTVYGGTDYTLINAAISSNFYSTAKAPQGFPMDPTKWTAEVSDITTRTATGYGTWKNPGSISINIPVGIWETEYFVSCGEYGSTYQLIEVSLSTSSSSESDNGFTSGATISTSSGSYTNSPWFTKRKVLNLSSKTTYYLVCRLWLGPDTKFFNELQPAIIRAVSAHL